MDVWELSTHFQYGAARYDYHFCLHFCSLSVILAARYADRVTIIGNGIRFDKVTRADNGEYDCEVSANDNYGNVVVKLTVLGEFFFFVLGLGPFARTYFDQINNCDIIYIAGHFNAVDIVIK